MIIKKIENTKKEKDNDKLSSLMQYTLLTSSVSMATIYSHRYFFADFLWLAVGTKLKKKNVQSFHRYIMLREKNACIFDFCMSKHFVRCNNVRETGTRFISNITKILCLFIVVNYNNDKVLSFFSRCSHSRCGSQRFDRAVLNFFRWSQLDFHS